MLHLDLKAHTRTTTGTLRAHHLDILQPTPRNTLQASAPHILGRLKDLPAMGMSSVIGILSGTRLPLKLLRIQPSIHSSRLDPVQNGLMRAPSTPGMTLQTRRGPAQSRLGTVWAFIRKICRLGTTRSLYRDQ